MRTIILLNFILFTGLSHGQFFPGLTEKISDGDYGNIKAVLISYRGELLYEEYFRGSSANDLQQLNSVTKSIGSTLVGIAHRQGLIRVEDGLGEYFQALYPMGSGAFSDKQAITVEHVLQQRHGIRWDELSLDYRHPNNPAGQMMSSSDWYEYVLSQPMDAEPGQKYAYSTGVSNLMSRLIRSATGLSPHEYAMAELFAPLGIDNVHWEGWSEEGMGNGMTIWPNPDGDEPLGFALWMRPRDMLKIGEMYLNGGLHQGRRILDKDWIDATWEAYSNSDNTDLFRMGSGYGYQWWVRRLIDSRARRFNTYYANGWGNQFIMVIPEMDLVVVSVADNYDWEGADISYALRLVVLPLLNPSLDADFNGAWYDPETDGQGLTLEVINDGETLIGFWYTFDQQGEKRWFTFDGPINGDSAEVSITQTDGGVFLEPDPVIRTEWGTGRIQTFDCDHISFEINSVEISATANLTRITGHCDQ